MYAERAISSKVHKMMQYACAVDHAVLYGAMKVNMTKSHFNLLQLILVWILCDRHHISKIIVGWAYYTSITRRAGLKLVQRWGPSEKWKSGNIFKMVGDRFIVHVSSAVCGEGGGGYCCSERMWNNYVEIHRKRLHVMLIMVWSTRGYNSLDDLTRQREVWTKILLQADLIGWLNPLPCAYFYNTQFNWWFSPQIAFPQKPCMAIFLVPVSYRPTYFRTSNVLLIHFGPEFFFKVANSFNNRIILFTDQNKNFLKLFKTITNFLCAVKNQKEKFMSSEVKVVWFCSVEDHPVNLWDTSG